jgi:hypothetical protein
MKDALHGHVHLSDITFLAHFSKFCIVLKRDAGGLDVVAKAVGMMLPEIL